MKWFCVGCVPIVSMTHHQSCPSCCGFRVPPADATRVFQPGRVTESGTGSWVPDRHQRRRS